MSSDVIQLLIQSFPRILLPGLLMTIPLTLIAFALALVIAVITALIQYARVPVLRQIARFYIWIIRGTPLLVQLMVGYYGPSAFGFHPNGFTVAVAVFAINEGAYCAETIRGSIEGVPKGQLEAGSCVGMRSAAGLPHGVPGAVQFHHRHGQGYVARLQHHGHGDVPRDAADRGKNISVPSALSGGRVHLPHFLHGHDMDPEMGREEAQPL